MTRVGTRQKKRKSPKRHHVKAHSRSGHKVQGYWRGHGTLSPKKKRLERWKDSKIGRPEKPKKIGDQIRFKLLNGHWVNGTVREVRKNYYVVTRETSNGTYMYQVTKGSILSALGKGVKKLGRGLKKGLKKGVLLAKKGARKWREAREKGLLRQY